MCRLIFTLYCLLLATPPPSLFCQASCLFARERALHSGSDHDDAYLQPVRIGRFSTLPWRRSEAEKDRPWGGLWSDWQRPAAAVARAGVARYLIRARERRPARPYW